jgi:hypothetical protein
LRAITLQNPLFVHEVEVAAVFVPVKQVEILKTVLQSSKEQQVVVIPELVPPVQSFSQEY